jgi:hypothetical protein
VFAAATLLLVLLLGFFAYALAHGQHQQRKDIDRRFGDRARVAATVNESLFGLSNSSVRTADTQRLGAKTVDMKFLAQRTQIQQQAYAAVLTVDGTVLASSGKVPADVTSTPEFKAAVKTKTAAYSSLLPGPGNSALIRSAVPFPTQFGLRIDVSAGNADALAQFLNSFLSRLPTTGNAKSYVLDSTEKVIATPGAKSHAGTPLPDKQLAAVVRDKTNGSYDGGRYFTSSPIAGTPWRIVLTAKKSDLYSTVKTTVPWLIFAAFVLVSLGGIILLWRVLIANAELERADLSRKHALEINDNVVQRLVLAKYALDRGATETSQQKLAETLRETQQLVTSMLEEREIGPGSLRRDVPAETEGRPDPLGSVGEERQ